MQREGGEDEGAECSEWETDRFFFAIRYYFKLFMFMPQKTSSLRPSLLPTSRDFPLVFLAHAVDHCRHLEKTQMPLKYQLKNSADRPAQPRCLGGGWWLGIWWLVVGNATRHSFHNTKIVIVKGVGHPLLSFEQ